MFVTTCRSCAERRLVFPSQILAVANTDQGIDVSYECLCGQVDVLHTGRSGAVAA